MLPVLVVAAKELFITLPGYFKKLQKEKFSLYKRLFRILVETLRDDTIPTEKNCQQLESLYDRAQFLAGRSERKIIEQIREHVTVLYVYRAHRTGFSDCPHHPCNVCKSRDETLQCIVRLLFENQNLAKELKKTWFANCNAWCKCHLSKKQVILS